LRLPVGYSGADRAQSLNYEQAKHNQKRCYTQAVKTTEKQRGIMELKTPIKAETSFGMDVIVDADGDEIARELFGEHARRIVACVNACAGISTEDLERHYNAGGGIDEAMEEASLQDHVIAVQQRGELLALVRRISDQTPEKPDYWSSCSQCEHNISDAQDVIAAVEQQT